MTGTANRADRADRAGRAGRGPGGLGPVVGAELLKLLRRPATWVLLGLWPSLQLVFGVLIPYLSYRQGSSYEGRPPEALLAQALPDHLVENAISGLPLFGGALLLTLGALLAGSEYGWGTLKTVLGQSPRRSRFLAAQSLALLVVLAVTVVVALLLTAAVSGLVAAAEPGDAAWPGPGELLRGFAGALLIAATWGALGLLLGTALRSTALPVGLGLVWVLAVESLVVNVAAPLLGVFDALQRALPGVNAGSLAAALAGPDAALSTPGVAAVVGGGQAAAVLAGVLALAVGLTWLLLVRRDVSS